MIMRKHTHIWKFYVGYYDMGSSNDRTLYANIRNCYRYENEEGEIELEWYR